MNNHIFNSIIFLTLIVLGACASTSTIDSQKSEGETVNRVLVLALTPIDENKETGENELVYWLRKEGYNAVASVDVLKVRGRLPVKEEIVKVLETQNFDGVITIKLVDIKDSGRFVSSSESNATTLNETYFYNYLNAWNRNYTPGYYQDVRVMVVESNLYAFPKGEIIFSSLSESFVSDSFEGFVNEFSKSLVKELRRSKVILKAD